MQPDRRTLLYGLAAAAGGGMGLARTRRVEDEARREAARGSSALATGEPQAMAYESLEGFLSKEQLHWHHDSHYVGALRGFLALDAEPTGSHRARIAKGNSVLLHELYFDNMTAAASTPGEVGAAALARRFGSVERCVEDFAAAAKSCRGWAVLAYQPINGKLYNTASDSHDDGPAWCGVPLLVVDVYEHSYYIDFQNRKADYVDGFVEHIDWGAVEARLRNCAE